MVERPKSVGRKMSEKEHDSVGKPQAADQIRRILHLELQSKDMGSAKRKGEEIRDYRVIVGDHQRLLPEALRFASKSLFG